MMDHSLARNAARAGAGPLEVVDVKTVFTGITEQSRDPLTRPAPAEEYAGGGPPSPPRGGGGKVHTRAPYDGAGDAPLPVKNRKSFRYLSARAPRSGSPPLLSPPIIPKLETEEGPEYFSVVSPLAPMFSEKPAHKRDVEQPLAP